MSDLAGRFSVKQLRNQDEAMLRRSMSGPRPEPHDKSDVEAQVMAAAQDRTNRRG
jgi:hypothetical protein